MHFDINKNITRISFLQDILKWGLSSSLFSLFISDLFSIDVRKNNYWISQVHFLTKQLRYGAISQLEWQSQMELLMLNETTLSNVLKFIDTQQLIDIVQKKKLIFNTVPIQDKIGQVLNSRYSFGVQTFTMKKGHSVVPHGHNFLTSIFLVLSGSFQGRHYDRIEDLPEHYLIKPTIDSSFLPGQGSTVSDYKNNVHWFTATSDTAVVLNIHVKKIQARANKPDREYINPNGELKADGTILAPKLTKKQVDSLFA